MGTVAAPLTRSEGQRWYSSSFLTARRNAAHASGLKVSAGPVGFLLSRTATASSRWAISTHWPLPLEWLLFFQWARDRSGVLIPHLLSLDRIHLALDHLRGVGRVEGQGLQMLEDDGVAAYARFAFEEQVAGHAVDVDQGGVGGVGEVHDDEGSGHAWVGAPVERDDLEGYVRLGRGSHEGLELGRHDIGAADAAVQG